MEGADESTHNEPDSYRKKHKAKTVQEDPAKLGFYTPAWQSFLQAAKLEMRLQAVLMHPVPDHRDALQLVQEVLDTELWMYHEKRSNWTTVNRFLTLPDPLCESHLAS
jgi:hypothetical protein